MKKPLLIACECEGTAHVFTSQQAQQEGYCANGNVTIDVTVPQAVHFHRLRDLQSFSKTQIRVDPNFLEETLANIFAHSLISAM